MMLQTDINISIPKQLLPTLPQARFAGRITVIDSVDQARQALRALRRAGIVGFDTETRPSFRRGNPHKVALMQLSTDDRCFLFRLNKMGLSRALCNFLQDPSVMKVGLSVHDDFNVMRRSVFELCQIVSYQRYQPAENLRHTLRRIYAQKPAADQLGGRRTDAEPAGIRGNGCLGMSENLQISQIGQLCSCRISLFTAYRCRR